MNPHDLESTPGPKPRIMLTEPAARLWPSGPALITNLYSVRDAQAGQHASWQSPAPELRKDWGQQIDAGERAAQHSLRVLNARADRLAKHDVPALEIAVADFVQADAQAQIARAEHAAGSLDRPTQLERRDALECAEAARRVHGARVDEQIAVCKQGLPSTSNIGAGPRAVADLIKDNVLFNTLGAKLGARYGRQLSPDALQRLLNTPAADLVWVPFFATHHINESKADPRKGTWEQAPVKLDVASYVSGLADLKRARASHLASVASRAQAALSAATAAVNSLDSSTAPQQH
jgi:hypothetical protein